MNVLTLIHSSTLPLPMAPTISTPFAKIFELPNRQQIAAYIDPGKTEAGPGLVFMCESLGVTAKARMGFQGEKGASEEAGANHRKGLEALLTLVDEEKAKEMQGILERSLREHIPHLDMLHEIQQIVGEAAPSGTPFARFVEGPSGQSMLLVRGLEGTTPYLLAVSSEEVFRADLPSIQERDAIFARNQRLHDVLPDTLLSHLGITPRAAVARSRRPGP